MRCAGVSRASVVVLVGVLVASGFSRKTVAAADLPPEGGSYTGSLRFVRVDPIDQNGVTRVVIEATGALPEPSSGIALNPPRIYLDFVDILPLRSVEPVAPNAAVTRIRVAEHSASPLVTRVVLDLTKELEYQIDASARAQGRVVVLLGAGSIAAPRPTQGGRQTTAAGTAPAATQFVQRVSAALLRLQALKPLLEAIDRRADSVPGNLNAAVKEFDDIATLLGAVKPPQSRASTHALLLRTCTLGARAARLRESAGGNQDATSGWDAASAAAGALLMFERANSELGGK